MSGHSDLDLDFQAVIAATWTPWEQNAWTVYGERVEAGLHTAPNLTSFSSDPWHGTLGFYATDEEG